MQEPFKQFERSVMVHQCIILIYNVYVYIYMCVCVHIHTSLLDYSGGLFSMVRPLRLEAATLSRASFAKKTLNPPPVHFPTNPKGPRFQRTQ